MSRIIKNDGERSSTDRSIHLDRQAVLREVIDHNLTLKSGLTQAVYSIRTHELLIEAGWAEEYDVPVNIYLLADVKESLAAGALLPLICILNEVAANASLCRVHILLNTAVFPHAATDQEISQEAQVYSFLLELDDLLRDESQYRKILTSSLGFESSQPPDPTVYLFDSHKEGSYVVKDNQKMIVMLGNALLALMQKDTARRLDAMHDRFEIAERASFYHSIGASSVIYDPASLQKACALRIAKAFLDEAVLCEDCNTQMVIQAADTIKRSLGDISYLAGTDFFPDAFRDRPDPA